MSDAAQIFIMTLMGFSVVVVTGILGFFILRGRPTRKASQQQQIHLTRPHGTA